MSATHDCPKIECWPELLDESAPADERERCMRHLESCPVCQVRLDQAERFADDLLRVARRMGDPTVIAADPTLAQVVVRLHERQEPAQPTGVNPTELGFLRPSDRPELLGTLGSYEVLQVIGQGGMGIVLKAHEPALHRLVAIKVMSPALAGSATARQRFTREARAAAAVCHDHVVTVHGVEEEAGLPYLVMQYVPGESLQARLDRNGPLEVEEIVRIGLQAARGLSAAHARGLIHRDIKPANILLSSVVSSPLSVAKTGGAPPSLFATDNGQRTTDKTDSGQVKITDFGLARTMDDVGMTQAGVVAGTPEYMAPEQARGEAVDFRTDLFSLGSVLYVMCTGALPFCGPTVMDVLRRVQDQAPAPVRSLNPNVPAWLESLIDRLLEKNPADRFQSAAEVGDLLERYLPRPRQPETVPAPQLPHASLGIVTRARAPEHTRSGRRKFLLTVSLCAGLVVSLFLTVVLLAAFLANQAAQQPTEIYQDFRGRKPLSPSLVLVGPDADSVITNEDEGLRIALPENRQQPHWAGVGVRSTVPLSGDFEVTGTYELLSSRLPPAGDMGVALNIGSTLVESRKFAKVGRFLDARQGPVYSAGYWIRNTPQVQNAQPVPAEGRVGQLRLLRKDSTLYFQVADAPGKAFRDICQAEIGSEDMASVHFWVNNRGNPTGIDARLLDFRIRTKIGESPATTDPINALTWRFLLVVLVLVVVSGLAAVLIWRKQMRGSIAKSCESVPCQIGDPSRLVKRFPRRYWLAGLVLLLLLGLGGALWLTLGEKGSDAKVAREFHQDLRRSRQPVPPLYLHGPDVKDVIKTEEGGLRITLPADRKQPSWAAVGVSPSFRLTGDFEVTGTYDLLSNDQPTVGGGVGVALELATGWVNNTKYARVGRLLRPNRGDGNVYLADHWIGQPPHRTSGGRSVHAGMRSGQLRLVRQDSTLRFLVTDDSTHDFLEIDRTEFGDDDLLVRFIVNSNGSPTRVDAHLVDLQIRAAALTADDPPPTTDEDREWMPLQAAGWTTCLALGVLMTVALGLALALRLSRRAGEIHLRTATGDEESHAAAALTAVSFSCSGCGTKLKGKAELAGKKIMCPKCGGVAVVPGDRRDRVP